MNPRLRLLGHPAVESGDSAEDLRFDRPGSLIVYLAVRGERVSRSELAFLYRPDEPETSALAYVRKLVFRARRHPAGAALEVDESGLRLIIDSDVRRFRMAVREGNLTAALVAYGGPLLQGAVLRDSGGVMAWLEMEREDLQREWLEVANTRASELERDGDLNEAAELLGRVLVCDPVDEDCVQARMRVLAAAGQRRAALRAFEDFRAALKAEIGAEPLETTQALADSIRRQPSRTGEVGGHVDPEGEQADVGSPDASTKRLAPAAAAGVPAPATSFIGRQHELSRLARLLHAGSRLVTVVGLGGAGKTRLAIEMARVLQEEFTDGAAFVSLGSVTDPEALVPALLERLGLQWGGGEAEAALHAGLRDRRMLLVLDSFEGVVEAAPVLVRLLEVAAGLSILVTSREVLHIHGEALLDLDGLASPPADNAVDAENYDAVRLFVQRAARIAPDFLPSRQNLEAIAAICRWLEGLPLAIELAATWVRTLSCPELRDELEGNAELLTTTLRDVPARHRSLWTVFDYTWERLSQPERETLSRLAAFRGGFTLDAAAHVAGATLPVLLGLMNRTLVRRRAEGRFDMHELVRQYAVNTTPAGTVVTDAVAEVHARYFTSLLARLTPDLKGSDPIGGLAVVEADAANFEAAWNHAVQHVDLGMLDAARDALDNYWYNRSLLGVARSGFTRAVAAVAARRDSPDAERLYGRLLVQRAHYERLTGAMEESAEHAGAGLESLLEAGSPLDVAYARAEIAAGVIQAGDYEEAEGLFRQVLATAQESNETLLQGIAWNHLGNIAVYTGRDMTTAERYYRNGLDANASLGNLEGVNAALINIGACRYDVGDFDEASRLWLEAADIAARLGQVQREAVLQNNLGTLAKTRGDRAAAAEHFERSLKLRRDVADRTGEANVLHNIGWLAFAEGRYAEARVRLEEALAINESMQHRAWIAYTSASLARTLVALGDKGAAARHAASALAMACELGARLEMLTAMIAQGFVLENEGRVGEALEVALFLEREARDEEEAVAADARRIAVLARERLGEDEVGRIAAGVPDCPLEDYVAGLLA